MCTRLRADKNNFPRYKYTNEQPRTKKNLCTHLLCICVSVYELKKSQPKIEFLTKTRSF
jgi:hypothetical protein